MDKSPMEVWGQMRFVDPSALGERWSDFADKYCKRGGFMGKQWFFDDTKLEEYLKALKPYAIRITKEDIGMKPPTVHVDKVILLGAQRRLYEELDDRSVVHIGNARVKADLVITQRVKLEQITGGFVIDDNNEVIRVGNAKARKLRWRIQRVSFPVVIFCKYIEEIDIAYETIKPYCDRVGIIYGKVKDTKKEKTRTNLVYSFQRGELDALIIQQRTGGEGIDLFEADCAIFYSMTQSWIDYDQARSRIEHRDKRYPVELFLIVAQDTIDTDKLEAVMLKRSLTSVVLDRLRHRRP